MGVRGGREGERRGGREGEKEGRAGGGGGGGRTSPDVSSVAAHLGNARAPIALPFFNEHARFLRVIDVLFAFSDVIIV